MTEGPSKAALVIEEWAERHDGVMTDEERKITRYYRNSADLAHRPDLSAGDKEAITAHLCEFEAIREAVEARLRAG